MTQSPERIWADPPEVFEGMDVWRSEPRGKSTEYIRADLVPQWRPIETAPKDGTEILVFGPDQDGAYLAVYECDEWWVSGIWGDGWTGLVSPPTHWMPLPAPPA